MGNQARHQRAACRVWDPGGGQIPDGGRRPGWMVSTPGIGTMRAAILDKIKQ